MILQCVVYGAGMLALVLAWALVAFQQQAADHSLLYPEDKPVVLVGTVELSHGYGPPGWGEDPKHDARIVYWVIDLPKAINTPCTPERPEWASLECRSAKRLRLIIEDQERLVNEARSAHGRRIAVTGSLHRQDTAGEITPIFMQVTGMEPLP